MQGILFKIPLAAFSRSILGPNPRYAVGTYRLRTRSAAQLRKLNAWDPFFFLSSVVCLHACLLVGKLTPAVLNGSCGISFLKLYNLVSPSSFSKFVFVSAIHFFSCFFQDGGEGREIYMDGSVVCSGKPKKKKRSSLRTCR